MHSSNVNTAFSICTETPEVDLDALLEDLCCMEKEIKESSAETLKRKGYNISTETYNGSIGSTDNDDITEFTASSPTRKPVSPVMVRVSS